MQIDTTNYKTIKEKLSTLKQPLCFILHLFNKMFLVVQLSVRL
jgi:hypothetical protein